MEKNGSILGLGAIALGLVGFAFGDYALQWQAMPADAPYHDLGALLSAAALCLAGAATLWKRTTWGGAQFLATFFGLWSLMHLPNVFAAPIDSGAWLGVAETLALSMGALTVATLSRPDADPMVLTATRIAFGLCCVVFGLAHFQYASFTASMVPSWLPGPLFWAYATGVGHVAAGLALLSGVRARLGVGLLTLMFVVFVVILHVPRIIATPGSHLEWTMGAIALSLTGAAFAMWRSLAPRPVAVEEPSADAA